MQKRLVGLLIAGSIAAVPVVAPAVAPAKSPVASASKSCSSGYTHAVIGGQQKCLRRGEYCAHRYDSQYRKYGYKCVKRDRNGDYHLT
jgi:hypothetical protein